ncbi:MAG: hypothetical protein JXR76_01445 [Deltaproteobacteria bacterium]|nr:hypothetical protein [Deltaproteobacteria bacterium]
MIFDVVFGFFRNPRFDHTRGIAFMFGIALLSTTLMASYASADKPKLAVFPVSDTIDLKDSQRKYLYDVVREAAATSVGSHISLINEHKVNDAVKKSKNGCDEKCALKYSDDLDARVALVVELSKHDSQILGKVKLLDIKEDALLTMKRFFAPSADQADQELQGAVMFVLSAQFLPLDDDEKAALQADQQKNGATVTDDSSDLQTSPSTPVDPEAKEVETDKKEPDFSNKDIAAPTETPRSKLYLIVAISTGVAGLGATVGAILSGVQLSREIDKKDTELYNRDTLKADWDEVDEGVNNPDPDRDEPYMTPREFDMKYQPWYEITFSDKTGVQERLDAHTRNINRAHDKIIANSALLGTFGALAVASFVVSTTFTLKYLKARRMGSSAANSPRLQVVPVLSGEMNGAVLSATF